MANFNSTNNIAAAGLLTGNTLNSGVTASSLTSVGTLSSLTMGGTLAMGSNSITGSGSLGTTGTRFAAGFFTDLTVTNAIAGSVTGAAGSAAAVASANEASDATCFPLFITASGTQTLPTKNNTSFTFDSSTANLSCTTFTGALVGNASTATVLATARTINGVSFDGSANITIPTAAFSWNTTSGTSASLVAGNAYVANNASLVTYTLPATAAVGDTFLVTYKGAGGYSIAQNALQSIQAGSTATSVGILGSLSSTAAGDTVEIVCITANTLFQVIGAVGNFTTA